MGCYEEKARSESEFSGHQFANRNVRERLNALPCACKVEMPCHRPRSNDAADAGGHRGAEAVERVFEDDGFFGLHTDFFSGVEEKTRVGLYLTGVIDGGDVVEVIVQAELVHP